MDYREETKLTHLTNEILKDAARESGHILSQIGDLREKYMSAAEKKLSAETQSHIREETARIKSRFGSVISQRMLENKMKLFARREEMLREITSEVGRRLSAFTQTPAYADYIERQLVSAASGERLKDAKGFAVVARAEDFGLVRAILERNPSLSSAEGVTEGNIGLGGVRLDCGEKHMLVDMTLDSALSELWGHVAEYIGLSLEERQ